jgi:hypothetical protein
MILHPGKFISRVKQIVTQSKIPTADSLKGVVNFPMLELTNRPDSSPACCIREASVFVTITPPTPGLSSPSRFVICDDVELKATNVSLVWNEAMAWGSPTFDGVMRSPVPLADWCDICDADGSYTLIGAATAGIQEQYTTPPFHGEGFEHLPPQVINCHFSGLCARHREETLTFLLTRTLGNLSVPVSETIQDFQLTVDLLVTFVIELSVLIEPIKFANLREGRSPIDFDLDVLNPEFVCTRSSTFDQRAALLSLVTYIKSEDHLCHQFVISWFLRLNDGFGNKFSHFVSEQNTRAIVVKSVATIARVFTEKGAIGWFAFRPAFELRKSVGVDFLNCTFPAVRDAPVNYCFIEGEELNIRIRNQHQQWVLLPLLSSSNESLLSSFFELVISLKGFVRFFESKGSLFHGQEFQNITIDLTRLVYLAIVAGSPFFYSHDITVLRFLTQLLPMTTTNAQHQGALAFLSAACHSIPHPELAAYVTEQINGLDDLKYGHWRFHFPEFQASNRVGSTAASAPVPAPAPADTLTLPPPVLPDVLTDRQDALTSMLAVLKRILAQRTTLANFPIHLVMGEWASAFVSYPECEITRHDSHTLLIHFINRIPSVFAITGPVSDSVRFCYATADFERLQSSSPTQIPTQGSDVFVQFPNDIKPSDCFITAPPERQDVFAMLCLANKTLFVRDITTMVLEWDCSR